MSVELCQACGQLIRPRVLGVALPPVKTAIVDLVWRAGAFGITRSELMGALYANRPVPGVHTVKVHICQINKLLAGTGYAIVSEHRRWRMRGVEAAA
jgi:hypothetical protein